MQSDPSGVESLHLLKLRLEALRGTKCLSCCDNLPMEETTVVIVGAGPAGLALATALSNWKIKVSTIQPLAAAVITNWTNLLQRSR